MGQAKNRGTFEQRKVEGEARREAEQERLARAEAEYEASLTPEQRERRRGLAATIAAALAMTRP